MSTSQDEMASSSKKRSLDDSETTGTTTKKPRTLARLDLKPRYKNMSTYMLDDVIACSGDVKPIQYHYLAAASLFQILTPESYKLQQRFFELNKWRLELSADWIKEKVTKDNKASFKLTPKLLARVSGTMHDIREAVSRDGTRRDVAYAAAMYESYTLATYLSTYAIRSPDIYDDWGSLLDVHGRFNEVLDFLEEAEGQLAQRNTRNGIPISRVIDPAAELGDSTLQETPPQNAPSSMMAGSNDINSDDYLRRRVKECEVNVQGASIPAWTRIHGIDDLKGMLDASVLAIRSGDTQGALLGILLHGPNGTGKSSVAYAFAKHHKLRLFQVSATVRGRLVGETEKTIELLFKEARACQPCVIFFEEADGIIRDGSSRDNNAAGALTQIKLEWGQLIANDAQVFIFAATNSPWDIPTAGFSRRFRYVEMIGLPELSARRSIFKSALPLDSTVNPGQIDELAQMSDGYTCGDIIDGIKAAKIQLWRDCVDAQEWREVTMSPELGKQLVPATLGPGKTPRPYSDLSSEDQARVARRILGFTLLKTFFTPENPNTLRKTVKQVHLDRHIAWQRSVF